ncbi:regulatory protein RecX [Paenibacillus baekrokdamisoli]|uniref:Regulatory protein RecX n=1 Tax=Paenibacillus baekrokdamisoli TaxID=1712516 RepID=A0A3G9IPK0_9BACL|nr:RecX family transcriptional regulator [Paenibacillus baekrokdamisoli]MBB3069849.1 regulatory protein [Paenibacillus baekrokdamisoli]BBH20797.1 regulatory protein RecX [Paenibacillus baekrokdamisoli]
MYEDEELEEQADETLEEGIIRITAIKQDRKEKNRYHIYASDQEEPFTSVHEDLLIKYRLLKGREIHPEELKQLAEEDSRHRAYVMGLSYLGARPRTHKEISRYLARKGIDEEASEKAIERLKQERLVDDTSYANRFATERMSNQLKGRRLLRQELEQRGIDRSTAKEASDQLDEESEAEVAIRAASKKWPYIKGEPHERRHKLAGFLLRRGFPSEIVKRAINAVSQGMEDDEEGHMLDN